MTSFHDFLTERNARGGFSTEDALASFLPLARQVIELHSDGFVAPLEGLSQLQVEGNRIWFEQARRLAIRRNDAQLNRVMPRPSGAVEVVAETRRNTDLSEGGSEVIDLSLGDRDTEIQTPVFLPGYVSWEHCLGHHDPLTDTFSLGMVLASLCCGLDFTEPVQLRRFVAARENLFSIAARLHPVLAQTVVRMTELNRHQRSQDLTAVVRSLENYRDQEVEFEFEMASITDFEQRDAKDKQQVLLTKLKERLFEISRRNRLLHFRPTLHSVNLTQSSVPLSFDIQNIRPDQILIWNQNLHQAVAEGTSISLNKYLNFAEALYLPGVLDRIMADTRRDQAEFGFAQLRLVACFLNWTNLKDEVVERFESPLLLIPVRLKKKKGIRDTYSLEPLASEAEVNPVVRHQFKQLYDIDLPAIVDLTTTTVDDFYESLSETILASEPAIKLDKIERPRIELIHEKARRRLDQYRRRARVSGRGVRTFMNLDYSYDPANYHPLGLKLFLDKVRAPTTHLLALIEERPRPRQFASPEPTPPTVEKERTMYSLRDGGHDNPYTWSFDLCSVTLANFKYRRMSLVRDYDLLLTEQPENAAFEATFSLAPRPIEHSHSEPPELANRYDVVPCDPTQASAIAEARAGTSYIIQGPPGTGKSQTITNLIADYVAAGKRVLFVCEKRAAIDVVYARLKQCGLGDLCCLIHDSQTDKKEFVMDLKETYEKILMDTSDDPQPATPRDESLQRLQTQLDPLLHFDAAMKTAPSHAGIAVRKLLDRCLETQSTTPELSPVETERLPEFAEWHNHREAIAKFADAVKELRSDGVIFEHPLRLLAPKLLSEEHPLQLVATTVAAAETHRARLVEAFEQTTLEREDWDLLEQTELLIEYAQRVSPLAQIGQLAILEASSSEAAQFEESVASYDELSAELAAASSQNAGWRKKLPAAEVRVALSQARQFEKSRVPWLNLAWWRLRSILNKSYDFSTHVVRPPWSDILEKLERECELNDALLTRGQAITAEYGFPGDLGALVQLSSELRSWLDSLPDWLRRVHQQLLDSSDATATIKTLLGAHEALDDLKELLQRIFDDLAGLRLEGLQDQLAAIDASLDQLPDYLQCLVELRDVPPAIGVTLRSLPLSPRQVEAAVANSALEEVYRRDRQLKRFDALTHDRQARRSAEAYSKWLEANAMEIRERVEARFVEHVNTAELPAAQLTGDQKEFKKRYNRGRRELEHEFGKSMRYKSIRDLVAGDSGEVVKDLKPVWLMSPLSVSDTLPLDTAHVDVVIFDEASQITLEEAIPSLFRATQAIVVGDEMQLPPTDFFSAKQPESDDELLVEEAGEVVEYELNSNSFLNHAAKSLPSKLLGWHYRSRSESLISFSNWSFYGGRLLTVPEETLSSESELPGISGTDEDMSSSAAALLNRSITFHFVDGVYHKRRNRDEADYIAQLVRQLLQQETGRSIGVVAFSEAQQEEIELALQRLAGDDPEFRSQLDRELEREEDGQFVGLLVKNLENIQGDERDIVILSICYGYDDERKMRMNFGPINKGGGEKRLNVAFSRAKSHMAVVTSIRHGDITNDYNDGANCLKRYLRYAEAVSAGDHEGANAVLRVVPGRDADRQSSTDKPQMPLVDSLAESLRQRGFLVDLAVGQSHFRCDLAVRREGDASYRLGILVDDQAYYGADVLERDVMRPKLLRAFGWNVAFVLAKDWHDDSEAVLGNLLKQLEQQDESPLAD